MANVASGHGMFQVEASGMADKKKEGREGPLPKLVLPVGLADLVIDLTLRKARGAVNS